jgi:hypothetical protein
VRPEGLCHLKIPMTPSGIEPVTCWFVAWCLNHYATAHPNVTTWHCKNCYEGTCCVRPPDRNWRWQFLQNDGKFLPGSMPHRTWQSSQKVTVIKPSNLTRSCESNKWGQAKLFPNVPKMLTLIVHIVVHDVLKLNFLCLFLYLIYLSSLLRPD